MNNKRGIAIILFIVLIFAVCFQLVRSNIIMALLKNENLTEKNSVYASYKVPDNISKEKFLIIYNKNEPNSVTIKNNTVKTLKYMKKDVIVNDVEEASYIDASYKTVIIAFEDMVKMPGLSNLVKYVDNGGSVFFAERPLENQALSNVSNSMGINSVAGLFSATGIKFLSNVLIKGKDVSISGNALVNSSLRVKLKEGALVLAVSSENEPLLWKVQSGKGNIMVFNGTSLADKVERGIIAGSISLLQDNFIYPVMAAKLVYIDDFPAPIPEGSDESISEDYGMTTYQFYREIWWPDVVKSSKAYNLKYTGTIIENYSNNTAPPFESGIDKGKSLILFGSELVKDGGEIGIHGYNHQSLAPENYIKQDLGYTPWKDQKNMEASLSEVLNYSKAAFPSYTFKVYVPPSNILSDEGRNAIKKSLPDIKIISSIYTNNYLGDAYEQEFEVNEDFTELPRITAGYKYDEETIWSAYNGITALGVFSHFIHPDDVLDSRRNKGQGWAAMLKDYNSLMSDINSSFYWLKPVTASGGADILKDYTNIEPFVEYKDNLINVYCNNYKENSPFILRSTGNVNSNKDCEVKKIDDGVYLVTAKKPYFSLKVSR